jgi:hypothetical protein
MRGRAILLAGCCGLAGGCASSSSYERWENLHAQPAYSDWARCIEQQSGLRMSSMLDEHPPTAEAIAAEGKTDGEIFAEILGACKRHMAGFGDNILEDKRNKRMLNDAYDRYRRVDIEIRAAEEAAII